MTPRQDDTMVTATSYKKTVEEIPMLFWISVTFIALTYLMWAREFSGIDATGIQKEIPQDVKTTYLAGTALVIYFGIFKRQTRLLTIKEAQDIAFRDAKKTQNRGEIKEEGRLVLLEDGVLRRIQGEVDNLTVAVGIEGDEPKVIVYNIQPYTGYILRKSKRNYWDAMKDSDLKIIIPPGWIDFLQARQKFMEPVDIV